MKDGFLVLIFIFVVVIMSMAFWKNIVSPDRKMSWYIIYTCMYILYVYNLIVLRCIFSSISYKSLCLFQNYLQIFYPLHPLFIYLPHSIIRANSFYLLFQSPYSMLFPSLLLPALQWCLFTFPISSVTPGYILLSTSPNIICYCYLPCLSPRKNDSHCCWRYQALQKQVPEVSQLEVSWESTPWEIPFIGCLASS